MTARRHAALTIIIIPRNIDEYPRMRLYARLVIDFRGYARGYFYVATSGVLKHELSTRTCTPGAFNPELVITSVSFRASGIDRARVRDCSKR